MEVVTSSILRLNVTGGVNTSFMNEHRFSKSLTLYELKNKLEMMMGVENKDMKLQVFSQDNKPLFHLDDVDDQRMIGSFQLDDGMRLHVTGKFVVDDIIGDHIKATPKYEISEEDYDKLSDSVRNFLRRTKKGRFNPDFQKRQNELAAKRIVEEDNFKEKIKVGARCQVSNPNQLPRRGEVMYVGHPEFKPHLWIGVKLDEPFGKNDGQVDGVRYFKCELNYGIFVRPKFVECGDFPELELDELLDEM